MHTYESYNTAFLLPSYCFVANIATIWASLFRETHRTKVKNTTPNGRNWFFGHLARYLQNLNQNG
jgi:hypothetical protein